MAKFLKASEISATGSRTLPGHYYTSPDVFLRDQEEIFLKQWICAGREERIPLPGDYFLCEVGVESIIIVKGRDNIVRAFYNVCRHRGTRLCEEPAGRFQNKIRCPYHAWTYALDGTLFAAPSMVKPDDSKIHDPPPQQDMDTTNIQVIDTPGTNVIEDAETLDPQGWAMETPGELPVQKTNSADEFKTADYPLHSVPVTIWEGFIFISLADEPQPFEKTHAPLIGKFRDYNLSTLKTASRIDYDVRANWKLIFQNYSECYHCSPVHPALVRLSPSDSGANDLTEGAFLGGYMLIRKGAGSMSLSGKSCGIPVGNLSEEDMQRVYYYSIFPNMLLSLHPDYVMAHTLWPISESQTLIECEWLFHPESSAQPDFDPDDGVQFWDKTNREDWHVCELSQLGVSSRAYTPGPYSPREGISAAFDKEYLRVLGD